MSKKKDKKEQERIDDVITKYLENLDKQLKEKSLFGFWCFPDLQGFKKINKMNIEDIHRMIKKDINKYKNRKIAEISICSNLDKTAFSRSQGVWLTAQIIIYQIDENGNFFGRKNPNWGCGIQWKEDDFKISKISFKLLETIMRITADKKHTCVSAFGHQLSKVVNDLKKKKIDISDVLNLLAGL